MLDFSNFDSLISIAETFTSNKVCKEFIAKQRWNDDAVCPYCGHHHCYKCSDGRYKCPECENKFSPLVGTIFENTKIPLTKWFMAMYLISAHKKGISSCQLGRDIHVTQKSAWFMLQKIRTLYGQKDGVVLSNEVECDELYLGGREKNKHAGKKIEGTQGRSTKSKAPIFGMVERKGDIKAFAVPDTKSETLKPYIKEYISKEAMVYTDENQSYIFLNKEGWQHSIVNHAKMEFVNGNIYTNTIEGFWGQFKRMIFGIYHCVSRKYLQRYIDEAVFRWNTRKSKEGDRFEMMFKASIGKCMYKDVVSFGVSAA